MYSAPVHYTRSFDRTKYRLSKPSMLYKYMYPPTLDTNQTNSIRNKVLICIINVVIVVDIEKASQLRIQECSALS